ncbi:MAG: PAS domain-containing protein [Pseudomonadota bacterium]|nr:PAS domain-containing protein [Pseudomonadota bacterium]
MTTGDQRGTVRSPGRRLSTARRIRLGLSRMIRSPLVRRVTAIVYLAILAIEVALFVPFYYRREAILVDRLASATTRALDLIHHHVGDGAAMTDAAFAGELLLYPGVLGVRTISPPDGRSFETANAPAIPALVPGDAATVMDVRDDGIDVAWPPGASGFSRTIVLRLDRSEIDTELRGFSLWASGLVIITGMVLTLSTMITMVAVVLRPLLRLRWELATHGELLPSDRVDRELARPDEVGDVYRATNDLLKRIAADQQELERRVDRRTVELAEANARISTSERKFRDYAAAIADFYFEHDADLRLTFVSERFTEITGSPVESIIGRSRADLGLEGQDEEAWQAHLADMQARRPFRGYVRPHRHPDGRTVYVAISGHPVFDDEDGSFLGYRGAGVDVTAHVEAEQALRASEDRMRAIIDHIPAPFTITLKDLDGRYIMVNRHFCERRQLPPEQVLGRTTEDLYVPEVAERIIWQERQVMEFGMPMAFEFESYGPGGSRDTFSTVRFPLLDPDGRMVAIGAVNLDITERKNSERQLAEAKAEAEAALENLRATQASLIEAEKLASLGQITAGIAHEIKNPLNFVANFAEVSAELLDDLLQAAPPSDAWPAGTDPAEFDELRGMLRGNLDKIRDHARRADSIVKGMLMHSRGDVGEAQSCIFNDVVEEAVALGWHGARAQNQSFDVQIDRDFDPAAGEVEMVPQQISRVIINLLGNAVYSVGRKKATDPTFRPRISVATRSRDSSVDFVIRDNGTGIPDHVRAKLFQPFYTTKPAGEGTGLGLSLSYEVVVQHHGGTIAVDSVPGEFAAFVVTLPRHRSKEGREA